MKTEKNLLTTNYYGTINGTVQLTKESQNIYCVFETWSESTSRGGYGHQRVPCNITVHTDEDEARNRMSELVDKYDVNCDYHTKSQLDPHQIIEVWEDEAPSIDTGDCTIHICTVEELFEQYNTDSRDNHGYNGIDDDVVFDLKMNGAIIQEEE